MMYLLLIAACSEPPAPPQPVPADLSARIASLTGPEPAPCGEFAVKPRSKAPATLPEIQTAASCLEAHSAQKTPAWFIIKGGGMDSWIARGMLVTRDGEVRAFSYDSSPSGGLDGDPLFETRPCAAIRVVDPRGGWPGLFCEVP